MAVARSITGIMRLLKPCGGPLRRGRSLQNESGAVAVEAALIIPLMVLMFAGIVEYGTMFRHGLSVSNAARQGARTAAVVGKAPDADFRIVQSTLGSRGSLSTGDINAIIIYKADAADGDIPAACTAALSAGTSGVSGVCNIYRQSDGFAPYPTGSEPWDPTTRSNDLYSSRDYIGVYIATNFSSPLQLAIRNRSVADRTVFRLDPGSDQPMTIGGTLPPISTTTTSPPSTTSSSAPTTTTTRPPTTTTPAAHHYPAAHNPAAHHPATHHPATHHPATHHPATHHPATHHPATHHPATHHHHNHPAAHHHHNPAAHHHHHPAAHHHHNHPAAHHHNHPAAHHHDNIRRRGLLMGRTLAALRQRTDGAAAVEFAILLPIILGLTLGIIDGGIMFFKWMSIGQSTREGVRSVVDQPGDDFADYSGLKAASMVFAAIPDSDLDRLVIYKATPDYDGDGNPLNNPPPAACLSGSVGVAGVCNVYMASDLRASRAAYLAGTKFSYWPGLDRDLWADATDTDYVGVYVAARVTPPTGVLGGTRLMSQFTVARIEPQATNPPLS